MDTVNIIRPYIGFDGNVEGKLAGTESFVSELEVRSGGALWNNGTWGIRLMRSKNSPSVHGTGRAMDVSWRHMGDGRGIANGRAVAEKWMNLLVANATLLGVEMIIDYGAKPFGRVWRCDKMKWRRFLVPTVSGGGRGDWFHLELNKRTASRLDKVRLAFKHLFGV